MSSGKLIPRRSILKGTAAAASMGPLFASAATAGKAGSDIGGLLTGPPQKNPTMIGVPFEKHDVIRFGVIGTGVRGTTTLAEMLKFPGVEVTAICDVLPSKTGDAVKLIESMGKPVPAVVVDGDHGFERLVERDDVDFVYIATPWEWHFPQAMAALKAGKHVGCEVPLSYDLEEMWQLVDASEAARKHCMMLENCCYDYDELLVLNMVRAGAFGELVHGEAAYNHDLRSILLGTSDRGKWRRHHHTLRDSNLYPTHGLGPVANYMNINRGDRFKSIVSMSSGCFGLNQYREDHVAKGDPMFAEKYICGDYNTSLIKTDKSKSVLLQHNESLPRPYDRINLIHGTKGVFRGYPSRIYLDADVKDDKDLDVWKNLDPYKEKYEHSLWRLEGEIARKTGGHGGMDYLMTYRLVECLREGLVPDMDVYDATTWSAPGPLSQISVAGGSIPIDFPDFTRGRWEAKRDSIPS